MKDVRKLTDADLAVLLRERNHPAFTEIYNRYWQALFIYAKGILRNEDEAADVVQDIFTGLWNRSEELQINSDLKAYLYTSTRHQALKVINKNGKSDQYAAELAEAFKEGGYTTDETISFHELCFILDQEIAKLPPSMRAVYRKYKEEGLSHKEIAQELGMTEGTSKTTLNRALHALKNKLGPFLPIMLLFMNNQ